ncbi:hypothetical protein PN497_21585 [Sphaerospermopsis kisseleviana CS-549]|uniref:Uncharacterized protein n=1 Tax=Sphaerospermopsis kisseleviana CS-549 TaxID=3021783 RepID=A0ABT4ZXW8_9CYAN|nr:hypothetical protein [Sphaerospermopsis kisseleviana]MDB9443921.1 hypothetical protein [Sphaerospermopsis kisseleviana CS-549]
MQHIQQLLATENSQISQLLKLSLYGLQATLNQARIEYPNDPGNDLCENVILEIHNLLEPEVITESPENVVIDEAKPEQLLNVLNVLNELREVFNTDLELNFYLGNAPLQSQNDGDLWNEIHRKLLRVPEDLATNWKKRALEMAQKVGATEDYINIEQFPFVRDEIIYPGLNGTVQAKGLCLSKKAFFKSEIAPLYNSEDLQLLAGFLLLYTKFIEIDPDLHHALKSVFSFDVVSLKSQPEQRQLYLEALSDRLQRTQKTEENTDPIINLRAWIDMDEAIHSLVFVPPAERYSWWGKLQQESRRILKKVANKAIKASHDVKIRQLSGLYADICAYSKDDVQLDHGGTPGEVLTCLRLYTRINQEEHPGRVLFRSLR